MKLTETIHLVASGASGFDMTEALDCNVFLFTDGRQHLMFDAGAGLDTEGILRAMRAGGLDPDGLQMLFLTHGHADHSGGVAPLIQRIPGVSVITGQHTATLLDRRDERLISLDRARGRVYPTDYRWHAPTVDRRLADGESVTAGAFQVTLYETPGHSADHCCYIVTHEDDRALIAGDALFADGKVVLQDIEDCSIPATLSSIRRLSTIDFGSFLPGHGRFSLRNGKRHVEAAMRFADAGLPPPPL